MALRKIHKYGDPVLRRKCQPVETITPEIQKLAADMLETMYASAGAGLAAPQVGVPLRLCVIDVRPEGKRSPLVLINPQITARKGTVTEMEGCLSIPGLSARIKRHRDVTVRAINAQGMPVVIEGTDMLSRALQHELDHLDGTVFINRLPLVVRLKAQYQIRKMKKQGLWKDR